MSETILQEAERLISGDRHADYGPYSVEAVKIADMWSVILGCNVTARQVPMCMIAMKLVRECNKSKRDNRVDIAGYCGLLDQIQVEAETVRCPRCGIGTDLYPSGGCTNCIHPHDHEEAIERHNSAMTAELDRRLGIKQFVHSTTQVEPGETVKWCEACREDFCACAVLRIGPFKVANEASRPTCFCGSSEHNPIDCPRICLPDPQYNHRDITHG